MNHRPSSSSLPLVLQSPSVLVLSATNAVLARARELLEPRGFAAQETSLTDIRKDVMQGKPAVVFIDATLYEFDPPSFDAIARDTGTKLAIVNNVKDAEPLLQRLINPANPSGLYSLPAPDPTNAILEADTAKYDKNTVHNKLEEMREIGEADTLKVDRKSMVERVRALSREQQTETARYDRNTVQEQLQRLRQDEEAEAHAFAKVPQDEPENH